MAKTIADVIYAHFAPMRRMEVFLKTLEAREDAITGALNGVDPQASEPMATGTNPAGDDRASDVADDAMMSLPDLARLFRLNDLKKNESLRKRLGRFRRTNLSTADWRELTDAGPREPKYLYRVGAVRSIIQSFNH